MRLNGPVKSLQERIFVHWNPFGPGKWEWTGADYLFVGNNRTKYLQASNKDYLFNRNGDIVEEKEYCWDRDDDGKMTGSKAVYSNKKIDYDEEGRKIRVEEKNHSWSTGKLKNGWRDTNCCRIIEYDANGNHIQWCHLSTPSNEYDNVTKYVVDGDGLVVEEIKDNGNKTLYEYDSDGNRIKMCWCGADGVDVREYLDGRELYAYHIPNEEVPDFSSPRNMICYDDALGCEVYLRYTRHLWDAGLSVYEEREWDSAQVWGGDGEYISRTYDDHNRLMSERILRYDTKKAELLSLSKREIVYYTKGKMKGTIKSEKRTEYQYQYIYDSHNNWVRIYLLNNQKQHVRYMLARKIEYYE